MTHLIPQEIIEQKIYLIRNQKVMLSAHLAILYGVKPKVLMQAVKRNIERFPEEFMFQLTPDEVTSLRSQIVTLNSGDSGRGRHPKYSPYAFTEHGVAMLASVLNSQRAIKISISIIKAFVKLRQILSTHKELAGKLSELERKVEKHDIEIKAVFDAIRQMMIEEEKPKPRIGFQKQ
jgi:phage regulator Rha-like protein